MQQDIKHERSLYKEQKDPVLMHLKHDNFMFNPTDVANPLHSRAEPVQVQL